MTAFNPNIRPMAPDEFKAALARLSMTQGYTAKFFGYPDRQARRWAAGDAVIPDAVALVLRLAIAHDKTVVQLVEISEGVDSPPSA